MTKERLQELNKKIIQLEKIDNSNTEMIDRKESIKELFGNIDSIDSDVIFNQITYLANFFENCSKKWYKNEIDAINQQDDDSARYWNTCGTLEEKFAEELRKMLTSMIRQQKQENRIKNLLKVI